VTVQDQIRLWELERNRIKTQEGKLGQFSWAVFLVPWCWVGNTQLFFLLARTLGFLYIAFASQADYEYVLSYARQLGVVLWDNPAKRCFFGSVEGHANIRGFIERRTGSGG
jgi:transcription initiation factor TFIIH subunit 4